jgi:splicing factor 3A subunit 1
MVLIGLCRDVIKLTAQFVARNGPQFHAGLVQREARSMNFEFLKAGHHHNSFFNAMVESYTRCLLPPKNIIPQLLGEDESTANMTAERRKRKTKQRLLADLLQRVQWERNQDQYKKRKEEVEAEERGMFS